MYDNYDRSLAKRPPEGSVCTDQQRLGNKNVVNQVKSFQNNGEIFCATIQQSTVCQQKIRPGRKVGHTNRKGSNFSRHTKALYFDVTCIRPNIRILISKPMDDHFSCDSNPVIFNKLLEVKIRVASFRLPPVQKFPLDGVLRTQSALAAEGKPDYNISLLYISSYLFYYL